MENIETTTDNLKIIENLRDNDSITPDEIPAVIQGQDITIADITGGGSVKLDIKLGDIVSLCAPDNPALNGNTFFVEYISESRVKIINVQTLDEILIGIDERKKLIEKTIIGWDLLSREEENGYSLLYGLVPNQWVNVYCKGDIPQIITGQITNLEEDMIEITPLNLNGSDGDPFYIDFGYKGIPEELNIIKIELREEPVLETQLKTKATPTEEFSEIDEANIEYLPTGEALIVLPENALPDAPESPEYDEILEEEFMLYVEIPENEKIYGIEIQTTELLEKMLEAVPLFKRTPRLLQNIHNLIERFKQLRNQIYVFDSNGFVVSKKTKIEKSIVESFSSLNQKLSWILPVVGITKKIYQSESTAILDDIPSDVAVIDNDDNIASQSELYENKINVRESNTLYDQYLVQTSEYQQPFLPSEQQQDVKTHYDVLVNNGQSSVFETTVARTVRPKGKSSGETLLTPFPFFVQRLLPSFTYASDKDKDKTIEGDKVQMNSVVMLPEPAIRYSRIDLPTTNILTRSELSLTPFYLFNVLNKRSVHSTLVNEETPVHNLSTREIVHYKQTTPNFDALLEKIIPDNTTIFSHLSAELNDKLSVFEMVRLAEPFLIYRENMKFSDYKEITDIIAKKIGKYILELNKNKLIYKKLLSSKTDHAKGSLVVERLIQSDDTDLTTEFSELFKTIYGVREKANVSSSEMLVQINKRDCGHLFYSMIAYILYFLITPDKLIHNLMDSRLDNRIDLEESTFGNDCARRVIAKTYSTMAGLEKDNDKEIFYDADLDETPYDIYKKYKKDKTKYSDKDFHEYLVHSLVEIHHCPTNQADEMATTLTMGKKKVREGEYAVWVQTPNMFKELKGSTFTDKEKEEIEIERELKKKHTYFKRHQNKWVIDTTIQDENGTLLHKFCNSVKHCKKNPEINTCEAKDEAFRELDNALYASIGEKMKSLKETIETIQKTSSIQDILQDSVLNKKYQLGDTVQDTKNKVLSPFIKVRQYILSESDFTRKQQYIIRFYTKFCREADFNEDKHWGYCRETNTKLFPRSIYELATAFCDNRYSLKLDELVFQIGELSTDGDSVVDKYTGYVLKRVDDSAEEGYDESGFKIITNAVIEKDAVDIVLKEMNQLKGKTFQNETAEKVYKIFHHIKQKAGIKDESEEFENFVLKQSIRFLCNSSKMPTECLLNENLFLSQKDFDKQEKMKTTKKENYKKQNYMTYMNRNIISVTISMFLIAIQTSIPGIKPRKTYPHCAYSYAGFPMTSDNDTTGITFLACIIKSSANDSLLTRENKELWDSIVKGYKIEEFIKNIQQILHLLVVDPDTKDVYLVDLYEQKKNHMLIDKGHHINDFYEQTKKWSLFLPPLVSFSVTKTLNPLPSDYKTELGKQITHGNKQQHGMLDMYKSKMRKMTYGIVEKIQTILKSSKNPNLLSNAFIQNSCCNENGIISPILYFIEKDKEILNYMVSIHQYSQDYSDKYWPHSPLMFFQSNKRMPITTSKNLTHTGFKKEQIYGAYIHYCNYDNDLPVDEELKDICNPKPKGYNSAMTLTEKINLMESNQIIYNEDLQIHRLMNTIHRKNIIALNVKRDFSVLEHFTEMIETQPRLDEPLKELLLNLIRDKKCTQIVAMEDIDNRENDKLIDLIEYLDIEITKKYENILRFFKTYGKNTKTSKEILFLERIKQNKKFVGKTDPSSGKNFAFVRNSLKDMIHIYPNIILNQRESKKLNVFGHWEFSFNHGKQLESNYSNFYSGLNTFFDEDDDILHQFLTFTCEQLAFYGEFVDLLPIYSNIEVDGKTCYNLLNTTSVDLLLKYVWFSVLEDYFLIASENEFTKKQRVSQIRCEQAKIRELESDGNSDGNSGFQGENDLEDVYDNIDPGLCKNDLLSFQSKTAHLIKMMLLMQEEVIGTTDFSYEQIKIESFKISDKEKKDVIERIGKYNKYEQNVDKLHRKLKMGNYYVEPNFHKNPYKFEDNPVAEIEPSFQQGNEPVVIDYGDNNRDIENEDNEAEDIGNPMVDEDDMMEDMYGEVRLDDEDNN